MSLEGEAINAADDAQDKIKEATGQATADGTPGAEGDNDQAAAETKRLIQNEEARDALT
jgi:uncharacterized protein YjbJ (UPF0337 family)